ncbi:hypothetical protein Y1Q_0014675 [Alligator mississippiensis]|nr:hypothetical protein Y1Q_0014675 [Alligator mississippiensis]
MDEDEPVCTSSLSESWYLIRYDLSSIHITFPDGAEQKFLLLSALTCEDFDRIEMLKHMRISQHTALQKTTFPYRNHSFCMRGLRISKRVWEM